MCPPGFHRVTTSTTCRQLDLQDTESLVLLWWNYFLHLAWVYFDFVKYHHPNTIRHSVKLNYIGTFDHNSSMALSYMFICIFAITFLGCPLGADSVWKSTRGTSADHIWNWLDDALDFFHSAGILCTDIFLRDRLPTFIATQFCMGGPLWVRRSPHSTCVDCVYSCFYYVCCMGGSLSKPVKRSPHVFIGEGTPAQAFSTFCSSTQSTDGWSDTTAFILTWTQCIHQQLLQVRDVWI